MEAIESGLSYEAAMAYWIGLDCYFKQRWWFALRKFAEDSGYLQFPASALRPPLRGHLSEAGGLLRHSMNVTRNALALNKLWGSKFPNWEVAVAGAFHDVGKLGVMKVDGTMIPRYRSALQSDGTSGFEYNPDCPSVSVVLYSLRTLRRFVTLPFHVEEAICHHDHLYCTENASRAHKEGALELVLHYADFWAAHCLETDAGWKSQKLDS